MESQLEPTIALLMSAVLLIGGVILIVRGLRTPTPALGTPAAPQPASAPYVEKNQQMHPVQMIFTGLASFLAVLVIGLMLIVDIPGRGSTRTEVQLTKIELKPTADLSKLGGAELGKQIYARAACNSCHSIAKDVKIVGPSLYGIWTTAASRKPGVSAKDYLHESIVKPGAFVVEGYPDGVMPQNFGQTLKPEEIEALLTYFETELNK